MRCGEERCSLASVSDTLAVSHKRLAFLFRRLTPPQVLVLGFLALITAGAFILSLPVASREGRSLGFLDALFTATSAVCVTGLVVVDTYDQFSFFGQVVILFLIQSGGLGIMTVSTLIALLLGWRISLRGRLLIQEAMNQFTLEGMVRLVRQVIALTVAVEGTGALLLSLRFIRDFGLVKGIYYGIFHAVSGFCNAGFDLFGGFRSLTAYRDDPLVNFTMMGLIITGGLGFSVLRELVSCHRFGKLSLHTKLVLSMTGILILLGIIVILGFEYTNYSTMGDMGFGQKLLSAAFQAVTPRTAGFNTLPIGNMRVPTLLFLIALMFIGASPASTGGGIKTSTFGVLLVAVWSVIRGREDVEIFERRIPHRAVYRALAVAMVSLTLVVLTAMVLSLTEGRQLIDVFFEATSAFGTVGLSTGITPYLSPLGRIMVIFTMFVGRVGPLTIATAIAQKQAASVVRFPEERILVG